ncbi:MAG: HEAT repeat domain-containing protein [Deltaproteobacteria bacterium]|nr:HEAT repeat domain-containing protein [Deltaproteobacteria bacterium]
MRLIPTFLSSERARRAFLASVIALLCVPLLGACRGGSGGGQPRKADTGQALRPDEDPRVRPHLQQFARVEAMITRWDSLRANGRNPEAMALAPSITQSVDADYGTFERAARGELGLYAQYLAVSALGFATSPAATQVLVEQVAGRDGKLAGNAFIALGIRADPNTPVDLLIARLGPTQPLEVKRYAPLALSKVLDARTAAGMPSNQAQERQAMARLGAIVVDPDPITRLHVAKAMAAMRVQGTYEYLRVLTGDPVMRVRWAAASALERQGDPRGFPAVVQLLAEVAPDSKHIIRDILIAYAGRLQGRPLTGGEVASLGIGPRAWSQWYHQYTRTRGAGATPAPPR